ncbi:MAG: hypothetical protein QOG34_877, partial [Frankiaceae bacterium]|nr:hypothetical protein [Frankiaceae bacterium]
MITARNGNRLRLPTVFPLPATTVDEVALGAAGGALLALLLGFTAHLRVSRLRR